MTKKKKKPFDKNRWGTPWDFFMRCHDEFAFTIDLAADEGNKKLPRYITPKMDALNPATTQDLYNERCWLNLPYSDGRTMEWMQLCSRLAHEQMCTVVALPLSSTDTAWWHDEVMHASEIRNIRGRIWFLEDGVQKKQTRHLNSLIIWRPGVEGPRLTSMRARIQTQPGGIAA